MSNKYKLKLMILQVFALYGDKFYLKKKGRAIIAAKCKTLVYKEFPFIT